MVLTSRYITIALILLCACWIRAAERQVNLTFTIVPVYTSSSLGIGEEGPSQLEFHVREGQSFQQVSVGFNRSPHVYSYAGQPTFEVFAKTRTDAEPQYRLLYRVEIPENSDSLILLFHRDPHGAAFRAIFLENAKVKWPMLVNTTSHRLAFSTAKDHAELVEPGQLANVSSDYEHGYFLTIQLAYSGGDQWRPFYSRRLPKSDLRSIFYVQANRENDRSPNVMRLSVPTLGHLE